MPMGAPQKEGREQVLTFPPKREGAEEAIKGEKKTRQGGRESGGQPRPRSRDSPAAPSTALHVPACSPERHPRRAAGLS